MVNLNVKKKDKTYHSSEDRIPQYVSEPEMLYAVRQNKITTDYLSDLKEMSGLKDETLSDSLNMNIKTFRSYKMTPLPMKPHLQEHVFAMLSLYQHGIQIFGSYKKFNEWMEKTNFFFDNDKPISFLTTISGIKHIDNRLTAMQYGDNV